MNLEQKMKKLFYIFFLLPVLLFSCHEDERELAASPDMLLKVRTSALGFEAESTNQAKLNELQEKVTALLMNDSVFFINDYVFEMKLNNEKSLDIYKSEEKYRKGKQDASGTYKFNEEKLAVTFSVNNKEKEFSIVGSFANIFYNHFVRKGGTGEHHIIEGTKAFCLHDDYTETIKEKFASEYPEVQINLVEIKTDLMTIRRLESFK